MSNQVLLLIYCVLILMASMAGGLIPLFIGLTHQRLQLAVSLIAGVMLGVGLLHMLPHALAEAPAQTDVIFVCVLGGVLTMFFIERFFCFHHHDVPMPESKVHAHPHEDGASMHELEPHPPNSLGGDAKVLHQGHRLGWVGASLGLTLHTIIAGIALAASLEAESQDAHVTALAGFGTFLAIFLHKPFDAMTITTLMTVGAWKKSSAHLVNGLFALMIPVGVGLFYLGLSHATDGSRLVAYALAFSSGTFLCVSMSDLLPELQFHSHNRVALSVALLAGLSVSGGVGLLESENHNHGDHGHALASADSRDDYGYTEGDADSHAGAKRETLRADRPNAGARDHAVEVDGHEALGRGPAGSTVLEPARYQSLRQMGMGMVDHPRPIGEML